MLFVFKVYCWREYVLVNILYLMNVSINVIIEIYVIKFKMLNLNNKLIIVYCIILWNRIKMVNESFEVISMFVVDVKVNILVKIILVMCNVFIRSI